MKTIEKVVFDRYLADQKLPKHKRIGITNYIDWAYLGAQEAQRWIPVEEELPEETLIKPNLNNLGLKTTEQVLVKTANDGYKITKRVFIDNQWAWPCGYYVVSWRPIERV